MGKCTIDHTLEDVKAKLADQAPFMPEELVARVDETLNENADQEYLNEVFHLLKKYDLADEKVREERNEKLKSLVQ
ncbi:group-specific protein [Fictibacillus phosphorivorans]|uniref:group-specific protein n=1 Tax=Fictibacillus phosphorivorans TaxID=1221500 RepID=UPI00204046B9|nr:group-specific protein [Fictibacillus phosphorivorans]MCM3718561.1 group-specific protein [Fictibacillus phosphorivorans]MCM3776083.1 group-specific protein [Fictibacillus phosphorivorans]